jgi:hypothetical protein
MIFSNATLVESNAVHACSFDMVVLCACNVDGRHHVPHSSRLRQDTLKPCYPAALQTTHNELC